MERSQRTTFPPQKTNFTQQRSGRDREAGRPKEAAKTATTASEPKFLHHRTTEQRDSKVLSEKKLLHAIIVQHKSTIGDLPSCSQQICREISIALKNNKVWQAWQALFRLNLSLGKSFPRNDVLNELSCIVIRKILDINYLPGRARHDSTAMAQLFLAQVLPDVFLQHHFRSVIEQKCHHFGGFLCFEEIGDLQERSKKLPINQITPEGQLICDGLVRILSLWRPVLSQARLNGIATTLARLLSPMREMIVSSGMVGAYYEAMDKLSCVMPVMDVLDTNSERGVTAFRSGCLITLNKTLHKLANDIEKKPESIRLAVRLLRSADISRSYRWQENYASRNQVSFLLRVWPEKKDYPAEGLRICLPELPTGPLESAWEQLRKNKKTSQEYILLSEEEQKSRIIESRNAGDALSCLILASQLLIEFPMYSDPKISRLHFDIFDAALETVAATLLLDTELCAPDNQHHVLDATVWLLNILGDWSSDALMLSQKSRWSLERLRVVLYQNQIEPRLEQAKQGGSSELQLKETLRLYSRYWRVFPIAEQRRFVADAKETFEACDRNKLVPLLPPQSDRVIGQVFGRQIADTIKEQRERAQKGNAESTTGSRKNKPLQTGCSEEIPLTAAPDKVSAEKPVVILKVSKNVRFERDIHALIKGNDLLQAATRFMDPDSFDCTSQDDLHLYQSLACKVISSCIRSVQSPLNPHACKLIHKCIELAGEEHADLPEESERLSALLLPPRGKRAFGDVGKNISVGRGRGRGLGRGRGGVDYF